jgi:hypothetical protein
MRNSILPNEFMLCTGIMLNLVQSIATVRGFSIVYIGLPFTASSVQQVKIIQDNPPFTSITNTIINSLLGTTSEKTLHHSIVILYMYTMHILRKYVFSTPLPSFLTSNNILGHLAYILL